jgi:hypothetical protein
MCAGPGYEANRAVRHRRTFGGPPMPTKIVIASRRFVAYNERDDSRQNPLDRSRGIMSASASRTVLVIRE